MDRAKSAAFLPNSRRPSPHPPGARCAFDTVGADHFIFGTDSPPLFVLKQEGVDLINKIGLTADEKDKVYYQNAKKLLKI